MASMNTMAMNKGQKDGVKSAKTAKKTKPAKPQILIDAENIKDARKFLRHFGINGIHRESYYRNICTPPDVVFEDQGGQPPFPSARAYPMQTTTSAGHFLNMGTSIRYLIPEYADYGTTLLYFDKAGNMWTAEVSFSMKGKEYAGNRTYYSDYVIGSMAVSFKLSSFRNVEKYLGIVSPLQTNEELMGIIENMNPYAAQFVKQENVDPEKYLMAPYLETLHKAGYAFPRQFFHAPELNAIECLNRLCRRGTKPGNIFKTCKAVYGVLKDECNMQIWDTYRKMDKFGRISPDTIRQSYDHGTSARDLTIVGEILAKTYNGKPVFTWDSLYNYLGRLDMYEAISINEALPLIRDYLTMCRFLNMRPRVDGDSLKREHDIAARLCLEERTQAENRGIEAQYDCEKKYNYEESIYMVRAVKNHADLRDEATQQHNCLAGKAQMIAKGKSRIFFMREVAHPDRSLISIELSQDGRTLRQALLAYNQPIRNKSQREFIQRWLKHIRAVDAGKTVA